MTSWHAARDSPALCYKSPKFWQGAEHQSVFCNVKWHIGTESVRWFSRCCCKPTRNELCDCKSPWFDVKLVELLQSYYKYFNTNEKFVEQKKHQHATVVLKTHLSASSKMMILCFSGGRVTFCWANIFILLRTMSMPLSLEAFSSNTASFMAGPSSVLAKHMIVVVLPIPGGP